MPLFQAPDSQHTHHHGLLAGVSAGAMAVMACSGLLFLDWHQVSRGVGDAVTVIVWAVVTAVIGAVLAAGVYVFLLLRHRIRHPEVLSRQPVRAEVVTDPPAEIPASPAVAELPAAGTHTHYHFDSAEAVEAALQAMQERQITEGHHDPA